MVPHKPKIDNEIHIRQVNNGGYIASVFNEPNSIGYDNAFTNTADLLVWITGELAPTPAATPVQTTSEGQMAMMDFDGWHVYIGDRDRRPSDDIVDVIYQNEMVVENCKSIVVNWSEVTHWRKPK